MEKFKFKKNAARCMAILFFIGASIPCSSSVACASAISDAEMEKALREEFGSLDGMEDLPDSYYDMDIDAFARMYLEKMQEGEGGTGGLKVEKITDPRLDMKLMDDGMIRYTLPDDSYYEVTAPNGIITSDSVTFYPSDDVVGVIKKDGISTRLFDSWHLSEPGNYQVTLLFNDMHQEMDENYKVYEVNHFFTIIGKTSGNFGAVPAPEGFRIISVKKDGVSQQFQNSRCFFLDGDGQYEIRYRDIETGTVYASTKFERDTTAPFLSFSQDVTDGPVKGPIDMVPSDPQSQVSYTYNGYGERTIGTHLTVPGRYGIYVTDSIGNTRFYQAEIKQTTPFMNKKMIIFALILAAATAIRYLLLREDQGLYNK